MKLYKVICPYPSIDKFRNPVHKMIITLWGEHYNTWFSVSQVAYRNQLSRRKTRRLIKHLIDKDIVLEE